MYNVTGQENKVGKSTPNVAKLHFATFGVQLLAVSFFIVSVYLTGVMSAYAADLTISGTLYEDDRATPITTTKTIKVAVATSSVSVHSTSTDSGVGTWSITIPNGHSISTSTPVTVFVDGDAVTAVTVTKASSTADITNLNIYQNNVTLKNEATGTTTKATDLYPYDSSDDADIQFTASTTLGRLTVADGQTLYIATSTTFHMDLPVVSGSFETATSATVLASSTLALSGDFTQNGIFQAAAADAAAWTSRTSAANNSWYSVTYGNGLFVAVSYDGTGNRVMTSPDGITWTSRTSAADNGWYSVTYGNGLFVAVAGSGTGNRVMTSSDGITWTSRTSAADNNWNSVTYGNGLFVAVSSTGTGNRVMTSPDGITWTLRTSAADNNWLSVTYGNGLFVAVANSGTGNRVMTAGVSTVTFNGASAQTVSGSLTGASAFGNVVFSGAGDKIFNDISSTTNLTINTTATTTFTDTLDVREILSASAGAKLVMAAGATTTVGTLEILGTNNAPVSLRSTIDDTQWYLDIAGEQLAVEYVNVKDSNASSSQTGEVIAINSIDTGNNNNWVFSNVVGSSTIADHDNTQVNNAFNFQNKTNEALFAFKLTPENGTATVTDLTITLSGSRKIDAIDFSNLRLFRDLDSDTAYDVTDEQIGSSGVMTISGQQGTIVFSGDFLATTSQNYVLIGDWNAPENGSFLTFELLSGGVISTDRYGSQEIFGSVNRIQHNRNNKGGGGGTRAAIGGEDIPPGRTVETGGTQAGGDAIDNGTGEEIGNDPSFRWPSANIDSWFTAANAYDQVNGTYATDSLGSIERYSNYGFSVPGTNQIIGVEVKLELSGTTAAGNVDVQLSWDGGTSWTAAKTTATLTTSDRVVSLGGPSDDWGRGWSAANFSNTNFAVRLSGNPSANTIRLDAIQVRVYHQATGGGAGGGGAI